MECGDQVLRNFLNGLVIHLRGTREDPKNPGEVLLGQHKVGKKPENNKSFKAKQLKKTDRAVSNVKYKNKKKS
jgi:hypothetical protein